ncbi:MAG: signal peptidase I [Candidatus Staskawiczbacteria bacterium RIFCSPLOWO2_12_FULL_37_15]|uniref:Signal peptidase I n=1 Tax=Candidatus Staskawiczbacteria bacterium RIFCSPLOWO2_12_FULL_37_15 TaxID=1802218 RepID=A0A1G2IKS1_9BACT|nr:MAG: signal peptidase I [Candidatus Staskawiczbacteria bacterium RIFCSPLOWO2_12_FULL_37_15]
MEETNQNKPSLKTEITQKYIPFVWEVLKIFIIASVIVLPIRYFLFQPFIVKGDSMAPNFLSGDYLIVDELSYRFSDPQRGEVIVFKYPKDTTQRFIKRVIGLPGETVNIKNGSITISKDGKSFILDEKYLPFDLKTYGEVNTVLGSDEFFVLGDNREFSYDSRRWGNVPREDIIGKALLRILPLAALSEFSAPNY